MKSCAKALVLKKVQLYDRRIFASAVDRLVSLLHNESQKSIALELGWIISHDDTREGWVQRWSLK